MNNTIKIVRGETCAHFRGSNHTLQSVIIFVANFTNPDF